MGSFEQLAAFYDLDYPDTADHVFLAEFTRSADSAHLLEIPCGSGRNVAVLLGATAREVTFADIAETMVDETGRRIPERERARARAVVADIRTLSQIGTFDLVICPREAFQLLSRSEAAQALRCLGASLTDDGLVVIDVFRFTRDHASPADAPPDYFSPSARDDGWIEDWTRTAADGSLAVARRRRQRFTSAGVHFEMRYELREASDAEPERVELDFDMTNYSAEAFGTLASRSGLTVLAANAGYDDALIGSVAPFTSPEPQRSSLRSVYVLGRGRCQDGAERLKRIREKIAADRRIPDADRSDAS
jgi:SAM-dependent methyltransferase